MSIIQAIILGIIQGITEFLPISSSGHLVIIPYLLGWDLNENIVFAFDVLIQMGTLLALLIFFWEDLLEIGKSMLSGLRNNRRLEDVASRTGWFALIATIPAGVIGLSLKNQIKSLFLNPAIVPIFLFITAGLLFIAERFGKKNRSLENLNKFDALWIGIFQVLSIIPGISRSGSTIAGGMTRDLNRKTSGNFSFLMAIPILMAAGLVGFFDMFHIPELENFLPVLLVGFFAAVIVGYISIRWLLKYLNSHSLIPFAVYCLLIGIGTLIISYLDPAPISFDSPGISQNHIYHRIYVDPELEWILPELDTCKQQIQNDEILVQTLKWDNKTIFEGMYLSFGAPQATYNHAFLITDEPIELVVNLKNPIVKITNNMLADIFSGKFSTWSQVQESCEECFAGLITLSNDFIEGWIFPTSSAISEIVAEKYMEDRPFSTFLKITSSSKIIRQEISSNSSAIGFMPESWIDSSIKRMEIESANAEDIGLPIIALFQEEPDETYRQIILCVQKSMDHP